MSNYPNMSYCMFQNTVLAMRQLLAAMNEDGAELLADMSRDERRAFEELFHACEDYMTQAEALTESEHQE